MSRNNKAKLINKTVKLIKEFDNQNLENLDITELKKYNKKFSSFNEKIKKEYEQKR